MRIRCSGRLIPLSETVVRGSLKEVSMSFLPVRFAVICLAAMVAMATTSPASAAQPLITQEEAALPPPKGAVGVDRRGVTRGPKIEFVSSTEAIHSPMHLQIKFQSFGGATIDPASVKVLYLRTPAVDLTPRIQSFVKPSGIDMPDASLPPGDHLLRIDIKDSDGRMGSTSFVLKVAP